MNIVQHIVKSGITNAKSYQDKRGILISNYISLILSVAILMIYLVRFIYFSDLSYGVSGINLVIGLLVFSSPILLNRLGFDYLGRFLICLMPILYLWFMFISQMHNLPIVYPTIYSAIRIFLLTFSTIPFLVFSYRSKYSLIAGILPGLISVLFFEQIFSAVNLSYYTQGLPLEDYPLMQMRTIIAYFILNAGSYTFHLIIVKNDMYTQKLLEELEEQSKQLELKNKTLYELNNTLDQKVKRRTAEIEKKNIELINKNVKLSEYAFINSHKLRSPLASILGLVNLFETHILSEHERLKIIEKIKKSSEDLDRVVKEINAILDETK
ncbi:hypothetical protein [Fulvivirga lutea]|uniref:histidine kinase n=1 Tax=Fulvivirga lutea TaxID=2810512 RepID=A0A975A1W0_9BACT|nr:hypothetical protein [Fulvivirga lutea]QSE98766.1 hypothetical protein JR347_06710 [Fulvivirga lutea]